MTRLKSLGVVAAGLVLVLTCFALLPAASASTPVTGSACTGCPEPPTTTPPPLLPTPGNTTTTAGPNGSAPTSSAPVVLRATLGTGQVNPKPKGVPVGAAAQFAAVVTDGRLSWALSNVKLSGVPNARLESGKPGKNGATVVTLCGKCGSALAGNLALTDDQEDDLRAGPLYIELNTPKNPKGELRGQIRG